MNRSMPYAGLVVLIVLLITPLSTVGAMVIAFSGLHPIDPYPNGSGSGAELREMPWGFVVPMVTLPIVSPLLAVVFVASMSPPAQRRWTVGAGVMATFIVWFGILSWLGFL